MHKLQTYNTTEQETNVNLNDVLLLNVMQAKTRYGIGKSTLTRVADEADAIVRVGRRCLFKRKTLDDYFDRI